MPSPTQTPLVVESGHRSNLLDLERLQRVPGWFSPLDQSLFGWFLDWQSTRGITGHLVELGVYKGKSAIVLGAHLRAGETLIVCDLFGQPASQDDIGAKAGLFYSQRLRRHHFENNYLQFFDELPQIVEGPSSSILTHVPSAVARFVHVDASHAYANVRQDILAARTMLGAGGLVVLDDYRTAHTPGVAAAVWESVLCDGLLPVCVSDSKFYGTWDSGQPAQHDLCSWLDVHGLTYEINSIKALSLIRVCPPGK